MVHPEIFYFFLPPLKSDHSLSQLAWVFRSLLLWKLYSHLLLLLRWVCTSECFLLPEKSLVLRKSVTLKWADKPFRNLRVLVKALKKIIFFQQIKKKKPWAVSSLGWQTSRFLWDPFVTIIYLHFCKSLILHSFCYLAKGFLLLKKALYF